MLELFASSLALSLSLPGGGSVQATSLVRARTPAVHGFSDVPPRGSSVEGLGFTKQATRWVRPPARLCTLLTYQVTLGSLSLSLALSLCLLHVPVNQYPLPLCILFIHIIHEPCSVSTRLSTSLINRKVGALQCITWKQKTGRRDPEPLHHGPLSQRPELLRNYVKL